MNIPDTFGLRRRSPDFEKATDMPMPRVVRPVHRDPLLNAPYGKENPAVQGEAYDAVAQALQPDPRPLPNPGDAVVQSFIDMGRNIANAMRQAGDACLEQGQRRKDEYYRAAEVAERKGEFQAREAGEFIDSLASINGAMAPKQMVVTAEMAATLPPATDRTAGQAVLIESPAEPEPPKAA